MNILPRMADKLPRIVHWGADQCRTTKPETAGVVRAQSNGRPNDPIPRSLDRHKVDDPSRPHGPGSRYPTGTTSESQA